MYAILGILGFLLILVSILGLLLSGIFFLIAMNKKKTTRLSKKILLYSLGALVLGVSFFATSISSGSSSDSSTQNVDVEETELDEIDDTPITKQEYKQVKIGMTEQQVIKIIKKSEDRLELKWYYQNPDFSSADITFDKDKRVIEKSEIGVLSGGSATITDNAGTRDDTSLEPTNEDYIYDVEFAIEDALGETVDWNDESKDVVKEIEINDNLGKNDGSKLILVHLNAPIKATNNFIKKTVNEQTLEIAKSIKDDSSIDFTVDSITYFWYLPLTDSYGKTKSSKAYKISLEKDTLEKINYEDLDSVDLPAIADQYNVLFKE